MNHTLSLHATMLLALLVMSCSGAGEPAGALDERTSRGESGRISFAISAETTPHAGENDFMICLAALPGGEALQGATLSLQTWMPSMSHGGAAVSPPTEQRPGCYRAGPVIFPMPGLWELHILASDSQRTDRLTVSFDIP